MEEGDGYYMTADIPEDRDGQIAILKALEARLTRSEETLEYETDRRKYLRGEDGGAARWRRRGGGEARGGCRRGEERSGRRRGGVVEVARYEIEKLKQTRADEDAGH